MKFFSLWVALCSVFSEQAAADTYSINSQPKYRCTQTGATDFDPVGKISLRSKNAKTLLLGKKSWTYASLDREIRSLSKSKRSADKTKIKELKRLKNVAGLCYDTKGLYRPGSSSGDARFDRIRPVLFNYCMSCHLSRGWTLDPNYFQSSNLVRAGQPAESQLYRYLRGNPEGFIPASMPEGGVALNQEKIAAIRDWIVNLPVPTPGPSSEPFGCMPGMQVGSSIMQRLTKAQLRNSLYDLVYRGLQVEWITNYYIWGLQSEAIDTIADDFNRSGHARLDNRFDESYLEGVFRWIEGVTTAIENGGRLAGFVGNYVPACSSSNYLNETCRNEFLRQFGKAVLKGTLSPADYDFYRRPDGSGHSQATYRQIFLSLLMSPKFLFHLEDKGTPLDGSGLILRLTPQEWVTRLAYTIWNSIPDEQLIQFAEDGTAESNPETVVDYVLVQKAPRAAIGIKDFFQGWFKVGHSLDEIATYFEVDDSLGLFLGVSYSPDDVPLIEYPNDENFRRRQLLDYRADAENEITELGRLLTQAQPEPVADLFRTRLAPVTSEVSRRNYKFDSVWDGIDSHVPLAPATRQGVLTRPAFHLARGDRKRTILAGRRIREDILCDPTGLPANNSTPPGVDTRTFEFATGSMQYRTQQLTERAGTSCGGCHQPWINPLGFAMEDIDSLGRRRLGEEIVHYKPENQGWQELRRPYNRTVAPHINRFDGTMVTGIEGLSEAIAQSDEMHACYTRNLVRFAMHRPESEAGDGCWMNSIFADARNLPMGEVLKKILLSPAYRLRRLNEVYP